MTLPTDDKSRKALPIFTFLTEYFPKAIVELVRVSVAGNEQHNPGQPLHWARGKSMNQLDTAFRHMWDHKLGTVRDTDGQYHLAKTAWRALAALELQIEKDEQAVSAATEQAFPLDADATHATETFGPVPQMDLEQVLAADAAAEEGLPTEAPTLAWNSDEQRFEQPLNPALARQWRKDNGRLKTHTDDCMCVDCGIAARTNNPWRHPIQALYKKLTY